MKIKFLNCIFLICFIFGGVLYSDEKIQVEEKEVEIIDGNGRMGRLIMMYLCFQEKISPFVIEKEDRSLYMAYLREQNVDIIFEKVKELQEFEKERMEKF